MTRTAALSLAGLLLAVAGCSAVGSLASPPTAPASSVGGGSAGSSGDGAARRYCTDKGGMLVDRVAVWNTNADPAAQLPLAGKMTFCEFESGTGQATNRIAVDLTTLSSKEPTLAAIAYLSKIGPVVPPDPGQNPGAYDCNAGLGGAGTFGTTAAGGGWVAASQPVFKVMNMCFFADGSAIDEFGIFYYANDAVRGADLAPLFAYQPGGKLPAVFAKPRR
jgi:hypothetical protein